jgi:uncharacterized RDD family membrane protein YckC
MGTKNPEQQVAALSNRLCKLLIVALILSLVYLAAPVSAATSTSSVTSPSSKANVTFNASCLASVASAARWVVRSQH